MFFQRVVADVEDLVSEVFAIGYTVSVIALLPKVSCALFAGREGEASLDQLGAAFDGLVGCGC